MVSNWPLLGRPPSLDFGAVNTQLGLNAWTTRDMNGHRLMPTFFGHGWNSLKDFFEGIVIKHIGVELQATMYSDWLEIVH